MGQFELGVVPRFGEGCSLLGVRGVPLAREGGTGEARLDGEKGGILLFCFPRRRYGRGEALEASTAVL